MNRYKPYYDPDERIVGMEIDNDGSWVHISEVRKLKDEVEKLREYAQERALLYSQSLEAAEAEVELLWADAELLRADAERYQWLLDRYTVLLLNGETELRITNGPRANSKSGISAVIDKMRGES